MRFSIVSSIVLGFAPAALATSSGSITSMMPMPTPSAGPVTMAWNDGPTTTSGALASKASAMNSAMQSEMMSMKSGMTMSGGMVMPTGGAMGEMSNSTGSAGRLEKTKGMVVVGLLLVALV